MENFVLKGNICYSEDMTRIRGIEEGYLICIGGKSAGCFKELPNDYEALPIIDYSGKLIVPGLTDLHVHAPQYAFRGLSMDLELLDWLATNTFPEEAKYQDLDYAKRAYQIFAEDLKKSATTRACIFGTLHVPATTLLMEELEKTGLETMVGKVNMDRNAPDYLCEASAKESANATLEWIETVLSRFRYTRPILTPRFIPTCSDELMERLGEIRRKYNLPMQSHLSENQGEIAWVKELCPDCSFYGEAYEKYGLFGRDCKTIMAHCVSSVEEEVLRMKENGVFVAHCPQSNTNLSSGVAPIRTYLEEGLNVGLGSDVAGGASLSIFRAMADAIQASKLRWRLLDDKLEALTFEEAFYLGTLGGGAFFGKVGSFLEGYEMDVVILDDSSLKHPQPLDLRQRLERIIYLGDDRNIVGKFVSGTKLF
ncbi:MAG: guanine deaminase [Clostridiales bacterium]|nr:guanine deaminase [Clostridiales bacterium]